MEKNTEGKTTIVSDLEEKMLNHLMLNSLLILVCTVMIQYAFKINKASDPYAGQREMEALYHFNKQTNICYTPALFINGRLLSNLYSWQDAYGIARLINAEGLSLNEYNTIC